MDEELRSRVRHIEKELTSIQKNTSFSWSRIISESLVRGGGFILGTFAAIVLVGWVLSLIGVIPEFSDLSTRWQEILRSL